MVQSLVLLLRDKELMVLPVISGLVVLGVLWGFDHQFGLLDAETFERDQPPLEYYGVLFAFYVVSYSVGIFFQAAVIAGACERLRGGDPTIASSLVAATRRLPMIVFWAVISATFGLIVRVIADRASRAAESLLVAAWSIATFFIVPVIVMEKSSYDRTVRRSGVLLKKAWGEAVVGNVGLGLIQVLFMLPVGIVGFALMLNEQIVPGVLVLIAGFSAIAVFFSALHGVWTASLYHYATTDKVPDVYDMELVREAFRGIDRSARPRNARRR